MRSVLRALSLLLLGAVLLLAESPTIVSDVLVTASGRPAGANLFISWSAFTTPGGVPVTAGQRAVALDALGRFTVALLPCPTGTGCYVVNTTSQGVGSQAFWSVYPSATPLTIAQVLVGYSPGPSVQVNPQQISGGSNGQCLTWTSGVAGWGNCTGSGGAAIWGGIAGTLANQADLATALAGKQAAITAGSTAQYLRGDLSLATFPVSWAWSALTGVPSTFAPVNTGDWAGTWQTYSPSHFLAANQPITWTGSGDVAGNASGATSLNPTLTLATVNSVPGACGSATVSCVPTTNGKGLVTSQTTVTIAPPFSAITGAAAAAQIPTNVRARTIGYSFNGGGSALTTQTSGAIAATFACTLSAWTLTVDAGTATIDVWKIATGTAIPTVTNTITASATPAIASGTAVRSTTLTGWTTAVTANDIFVFNLSAVSSATKATLSLECDQ